MRLINYHDGGFYNADCLDAMARLPDGCVDMILCDLPYGTTACAWDSVIPFADLWKQYKRVIRPNAAIVLTAAQPFTTALITSNFDMFKYSLVWEKSSATGAMDCRFRPLKAHEDIAVFSAGGCSNGSKFPVRYNPQMTSGKPYTVKRNNVEKSRSFVRSATIRIDTESNGDRYPRSVLYFKNETGLHPTQKPVALFEYLIKTYTNPGDIVLDNTAGSGTTAVAARNTGRRWICMERDPTYFDLATERVSLTHRCAA